MMNVDDDIEGVAVGANEESTSMESEKRNETELQENQEDEGDVEGISTPEPAHSADQSEPRLAPIEDDEPRSPETIPETPEQTQSPLLSQLSQSELETEQHENLQYESVSTTSVEQSKPAEPNKNVEVHQSNAALDASVDNADASKNAKVCLPLKFVCLTLMGVKSGRKSPLCGRY